MLPLLYIVLPCFNNAEIIAFSIRFYKDKLEEMELCEKISPLSRILLVDNGSHDGTWEKISEASKKDTAVSGIKLSKFSGFNNAVLCGLEESKRFCDIAVVADIACRKDINAIDRMVEQYRNGSQIVFGVRSQKRDRDSRFSFGAMRRGRSKPRLDFGFFLLSKKIICELGKYSDHDLDLPGVILAIDSSPEFVFYSKRNTFSLKRKIDLLKAREGFLSFFNTCSYPIHIIFTAGLILCVSFLSVLIVKLILILVGIDCEIYKTFLFFLLSLIILITGTMGEYIIKVVEEVKNHPRFIVSDTTEVEEK